MWQNVYARCPTGQSYGREFERKQRVRRIRCMSKTSVTFLWMPLAARMPNNGSVTSVEALASSCLKLLRIAKLTVSACFSLQMFQDTCNCAIFKSYPCNVSTVTNGSPPHTNLSVLLIGAHRTASLRRASTMAHGMHRKRLFLCILKQFPSKWSRYFKTIFSFRNNESRPIFYIAESLDNVYSFY